jgi:hypothetical protein
MHQWQQDAARGAAAARLNNHILFFQGSYLRLPPPLVVGRHHDHDSFAWNMILDLFDRHLEQRSPTVERAKLFRDDHALRIRGQRT